MCYACEYSCIRRVPRREIWHKERIPQGICRVKLFVEVGDPASAALEQKMRDAHIDFLSSSGDGPTTAWIDEDVIYGVPAVTKAVDLIIENLEKWREERAVEKQKKDADCYSNAVLSDLDDMKLIFAVDGITKGISHEEFIKQCDQLQDELRRREEDKLSDVLDEQQRHRARLRKENESYSEWQCVCKKWNDDHLGKCSSCNRKQHGGPCEDCGGKDSVHRHCRECGIIIKKGKTWLAEADASCVGTKRNICRVCSTAQRKDALNGSFKSWPMCQVCSIPVSDIPLPGVEGYGTEYRTMCECHYYGQKKCQKCCDADKQLKEAPKIFHDPGLCASCKSPVVTKYDLQDGESFVYAGDEDIDSGAAQFITHLMLKSGAKVSLKLRCPCIDLDHASEEPYCTRCCISKRIKKVQQDKIDHLAWQCSCEGWNYADRDKCYVCDRPKDEAKSDFLKVCDQAKSFDFNYVTPFNCKTCGIRTQYIHVPTTSKKLDDNGQCPTCAKEAEPFSKWPNCQACKMPISRHEQPGRKGYGVEFLTMCKCHQSVSKSGQRLCIECCNNQPHCKDCDFVMIENTFSASLVGGDKDICLRCNANRHGQCNAKRHTVIYNSGIDAPTWSEEALNFPKPTWPEEALNFPKEEKSVADINDKFVVHSSTAQRVYNYLSMAAWVAWGYMIYDPSILAVVWDYVTPMGIEIRESSAILGITRVLASAVLWICAFVAVVFSMVLASFSVKDGFESAWSLIADDVKQEKLPAITMFLLGIVYFLSIPLTVFSFVVFCVWKAVRSVVLYPISTGIKKKEK